MNPMQPSDNQMPGQPPSGAPPATTLSSINVDAARVAFTAPQNRPYLIAAIGGLVAFLSFLLFDFYGVSATALGVTRSDSFNGLGAAGSPGGYWLLWLAPLAALAALAIASLITLGINAVRQITPANAGRTIVIAGAIGLVAEIIVAIKANGDASSALGLTTNADLSALGIKISAGLGFGFWLMLLAFIAVIVGGVMNMRQTQAVSMPGAAM
ncbi:MAG TPA: hypothetical protein VKT52_00655 [Ktedonobacterales bacterium]|nr:hypothetical protein [Ktedonobacterales bacterium]